MALGVAIGENVETLIQIDSDLIRITSILKNAETGT